MPQWSVQTSSIFPYIPYTATGSQMKSAPAFTGTLPCLGQMLPCQQDQSWMCAGASAPCRLNPVQSMLSSTNIAQAQIQICISISLCTRFVGGRMQICGHNLSKHNPPVCGRRVICELYSGSSAHCPSPTHRNTESYTYNVLCWASTSVQA